MVLLETFITFTRDMEAVEKTMRFLQASFSAATYLAPPNYRLRAAHVKSQINHSRRFFRVFMWIECWSTAANSYRVGALKETITRLGNATLGMYLFLDMLILPFALGALDESDCSVWVQQLTGHEGVDVKVIEHASFLCWFYAILLSSLLLILEVLASRSDVKEEAKKADFSEKSFEKHLDSRQSGYRIIQRLSRSICDVVVSGAASRSINIHPILVAVAMAVSSLVSMQEIWGDIRIVKLMAKGAASSHNLRDVHT